METGISGGGDITSAQWDEIGATKRQIQAGNCTNKPTATVKILNPEAYNTIFDYFKLLLESKGGLMLPRYSGDDVFLDYLDTKGKTSSQEIYFGKNLLDLENYISADHIACCGPLPMMKAVAAIAREQGIDCEVSLENMMACGLGACLCCVEDTRDEGNVCVCKEGPVFNINRLKW